MKTKEFTHNENEELVRTNPMNIRYVKEPNEELQLLAISINPKSIKYISNPTANVLKISNEISNPTLNDRYGIKKILNQELEKNTPEQLNHKNHFVLDNMVF